MLSFFVASVLSALKSGDNPYEILNISKSSDKTTIKSAYRRLTRKYHPDYAKGTGSSEMWMKINDAYELLSNPDRKARFDNTGKVEEEEDMTVGPFGTNFRYFGKHESGESLKTPLINNINFDSFIANGNETLLLFYSSNLTDLDGYVELFEAFNDNYNKLWQCGRVDMALGTSLANELGIMMVPSFVYVRVHNETHSDPDNLTDTQIISKRTVYVAPRPLISLVEILSFLTSPQIWPTFLYTIKNKQELDNFLNNDPLVPHIFQLTRSMSASPRFKKIASVARQLSYFAEVIDTDFSIGKLFNISIYPALVSIRGPNAPPVIEDDMKKMGQFINVYGISSGFEFEYYSSQRLCEDSCFVYIINTSIPGKENGFTPEMAKKVAYLNYSIAWAPLSSPRIQQLGFNEEGQWLVYFGNVRKYIKLEKTETINDQLFLDLRRKVKKSEVEVLELPNDWEMDNSWNGLRLQYNIFIRDLKSFLKSLPTLHIVIIICVFVAIIVVFILFIKFIKFINRKLTGADAAPKNKQPTVSPRKFKQH